MFKFRFDTSLGGFVYEDQFLQFTAKMPSQAEIFGFGEHEHHSMRHDITTWKTLGMWARDQPPVAVRTWDETFFFFFFFLQNC